MPQKYTALIRACPDGEGVWSSNKNNEQIQNVRRKGKFNTELVKNITQEIDNEKAPIVLIDTGGIRSEENKNKEIANINIENLDKYKISDEANQILAVIYKKYFASEKEKQIIKAKERLVFEKRQEELRKKYSVDNLWKSKKG